MHKSFPTPLAETAGEAVLDTAHIGDIHGAFGSIKLDDIAPRTRWRDRLRTLLAIIGPGLIVMVGDNDAGPLAPIHRPGRTMALACCGRCCCWYRCSM
jgi:hypothetical protein